MVWLRNQSLVPNWKKMTQETALQKIHQVYNIRHTLKFNDFIIISSTHTQPYLLPNIFLKDQLQLIHHQNTAVMKMMICTCLRKMMNLLISHHTLGHSTFKLSTNVFSLTLNVPQDSSTILVLVSILFLPLPLGQSHQHIPPVKISRWCGVVQSSSQTIFLLWSTVMTLKELA